MTFKGADTKASSHSSIWTNPAYLWHSGKIIPWDEAKVHITSMSWTAVSAVFEGIRAYWNVEQEELYIFRMDSHMRRLADSMKLMRMLPPYSGQELIDSVIKLLKANQVREDTYIMPFAYFTGSVPGYRAAYQQPSEVFITAVSSSSSLARNSGIHCCISSWVRIADNVMPPRAKGIANYQNSRLVSTEAYLNGYDAGIILNSQGKVAEGAYACIFILRDGVAITPPVTAGILEGITRDTVIRLFREDLGIPVEEREVDRTEIYVADEVFLCGTYAEIQSVASVDRYRIGSGRPGRITKRLRRLYSECVMGKSHSHLPWNVPVWHAA